MGNTGSKVLRRCQEEVGSNIEYLGVYKPENLSFRKVFFSLLQCFWQVFDFSTFEIWNHHVTAPHICAARISTIASRMARLYV